MLLIFDDTKPNGNDRKLLDSSIIFSLGWKPQIKLDEGLKNTYSWYLENIKSLHPYSSARDEFKEISSAFIFMDANENPFESGLNRYPDPQQNLVKEALSKILEGDSSIIF